MAHRISYYPIAILLILYSSVAKCQQDQWTADELRRANTATTAYYMTEQERDVILYMNLARMYPQKYARVEVEPYNNNSSYKASLLAELRNNNNVAYDFGKVIFSTNTNYIRVRMNFNSSLSGKKEFTVKLFGPDYNGYRLYNSITQKVKMNSNSVTFDNIGLPDKQKNAQSGFAGWAFFFGE